VLVYVCLKCCYHDILIVTGHIFAKLSALHDKDRRLKFLGQKVKVEGRGGVTVCLWLRCLQEKVAVRSGSSAADKSTKIAKELSDLVVYCQPVSFEWDNGRLHFFPVFFALFALFFSS